MPARRDLLLASLVFVSGISSFFVGSVSAALIRQDSSSKPSSSVDFEREILPIFKTHCFECHSADVNDGDLRLDREEAARRGGHTGRPILISPATESELYQRLISTEPDYRMPKHGDPLSEDQILRVKNWLDQGAQWTGATSSRSQNESEQSTAPSVAQGPEVGWIEWLGQRFFELSDRLGEPRFQFLSCFRWFLAAGLLYFVLVLATKLKQFRRRRQRSKAASKTGATAQPPTPAADLTDRLCRWRYLGLGLLAIGAAGVLLYQQGLIEELKESAKLAQNSNRRQAPIKITEDRTALVLPVYPNHPPRLGGLYYRGNDERDPSLFNGGVYRTATMELWLVDEQGKKIQWNEILPEQAIWISLLIRRAPRTTAALYTEAIFRETYLRRFRETELISGDRRDESGEVDFQVVEPGQVWEARIPLEPCADWKNGHNSGVVYLFYGAQIQDGFRGRVHYGIRYDLKTAAGKLTRESVLWMGAIYDLGGRVLIPQDKEVPLNQWFDYQPLPEIEIENPEDPELLGIPEHLAREPRP